MSDSCNNVIILYLDNDGDPVNKVVSVAGSGKHRRHFPLGKPWGTLAS